MTGNGSSGGSLRGRHSSGNPGWDQGRESQNQRNISQTSSDREIMGEVGDPPIDKDTSSSDNDPEAGQSSMTERNLHFQEVRSALLKGTISTRNPGWSTEAIVASTPYRRRNSGQANGNQESESSLSSSPFSSPSLSLFDLTSFEETELDASDSGSDMSIESDIVYDNAIDNPNQLSPLSTWVAQLSYESPTTSESEGDVSDSGSDMSIEENILIHNITFQESEHSFDPNLPDDDDGKRNVVFEGEDIYEPLVREVDQSVEGCWLLEAGDEEFPWNSSNESIEEPEGNDSVVQLLFPIQRLSPPSRQEVLSIPDAKFFLQ